MKKIDWNEKSLDELRSSLAERQVALVNLRLQASVRGLNDTSQLGKHRKEIARIKTVIRGKEA